jgi:hypothetical protein
MIGVGLFVIGVGVFLWVFTVRWRRTLDPPSQTALIKTPLVVDKGTMNWRYMRQLAGIMVGIALGTDILILIAVTLGRRNSPTAPDDRLLVAILLEILAGCLALGLGVGLLVYRPWRLTIYEAGLDWGGGMHPQLFLGYEDVDPATIRAVRHLERVKTMVDKSVRANAGETGTGDGIVFLCPYELSYGYRGAVSLSPTTAPRLWTITTRGDPVQVANALMDAAAKHRGLSDPPAPITVAEELTGDSTDALRQLSPVTIDGI